MSLFHLKQNTKKDEGGSRPILQGGLAHSLSTDPFLDWVIILVIGLTVAAVLVGIDVSVYLKTGDMLAKEERSDGVKPALPIDDVLLDRVLREYADRASERSSIPSRYTVPRDPSLP